MTIRKATVEDIDLLIRLRLDYLAEDKGFLAQAEKTAIEKQLTGYFTRHIKERTFIGALAETDGQIVSTGFLAIAEKPANPAFITGRTATLLNVLTYPAYRRKGLAAKVISFLIAEARMAGVSSIDLSATADGRHLYETLGFELSVYTPMRMVLD